MAHPKLGTPLSKKNLSLLSAFAKSVRHSIVEMTTNAQSGHPGGSLSCADYLTLLYANIIGRTGEPVIVSNGHISPAVYSVLAEMGYIAKKNVVKNFRKFGHPYEGHVTRHVPGVWYGTGPLGAGVSAASGFALAQKLKKQKGHTYALLGDGESQEGQVYEMMNFAAKYKLNNFVAFLDFNRVQLTDSLKNIMPMSPKKHFAAAGWKVIDVDGHDFEAMWRALGQAHKVKNKPVLLNASTIMGKGALLMEPEGLKDKATWHGKTAKPDQIAETLAALTLTKKEENVLETFRAKRVKWKPKKSLVIKTKVKTGRVRVYGPDKLTDCRSAYGNALLDLASANKHVVALTADLAGSVKTSLVKKELPEQHIECGIAEQHMVSASGGLSLFGIVPFCSTFGAFMSSRAKDQARVNDINDANVKMVATHCGLSVGADGPTHQAIDDVGSFLGMFNTKIIEPVDPNQCDRIIRYVAREYGNFYVRMGRHKIPVLTKANGKPFYGRDYKFVYGKTDILRRGKHVTIAAGGATAIEAFQAWEKLREVRIEAEIVIVSSPKKFDAKIFNSIKKTKRLITVEDHNTRSGFGSQLTLALEKKGVHPKKFVMLGVDEYQLSGTAPELYKAGGIDSSAIVRAAKKMLRK